MKKRFPVFFICSFFISLIQAQSSEISDSSYLIILNKEIDNHVVNQNISALEILYADDFVFSHGSGNIEGKKGWFVSVAKGNFISRLHDSVTVELHPGIGIVKGKLSVQKKGKEKTERYHLKYIRVYVLRNKQWQLISHSTISEYHEPDQ